MGDMDPGTPHRRKTHDSRADVLVCSILSKRGRTSVLSMSVTAAEAPRNQSHKQYCSAKSSINDHLFHTHQVVELNSVRIRITLSSNLVVEKGV